MFFFGKLQNFEYGEMNYYGFMVSEGITINFPMKMNNS